MLQGRTVLDITALVLVLLGSDPLLRPWAITRLAVTPTVAQVGEVIGDNEIKIEGTLSSDSPKDKKTGTASKIHPFQMKAGTAYVIRMNSTDVDSYLRLEDSQSKMLAENDDDDALAGKSLNARIVFKCEKDGEYKVICTTFPVLVDKKLKATGKYTLIVAKATKEEVAKAFPHDAMIGKAAPAITGEFCLNGTTKKLADLKGKVVLVDFWAVWCTPCINTFPHLRDWFKEYQKDGLEILGVTTYFESFKFDKEAGKLISIKAEKDKEGESTLKPAEEQAMIKEFASYHKLSHQIMMVSKSTWAQANKDYSIPGIPTVALLDRQGNVRMVRVGADPENAAALQEEIKKLLAEKQASSHQLAQDSSMAAETNARSKLGIPAGPATRRLARQVGIDLALVPGSASGGRVTQEDVMAFVRNPRSRSDAPVTRAPATLHLLADITELERIRNPQGSQEVKASLLAFIMKASANALGQFPEFNSTLDMANSQNIHKNDCHLGVVTDDGPAVIVRDVNKKRIRDLARELAQAMERVRQGQLSDHEASGSTFTITDLSAFGGMFFTPVIRPPKVASLGLSQSRLQPGWNDKGEVTPRGMLPLSLSFDSGAADMAHAARFVKCIVENLENPLIMLING